MVNELKHPFTGDAVAPLRAGQRVRVSGPLITARCRVHQALLDGTASPVKLDGAAILHASPFVVREDQRWVVRAAGCTGLGQVDTYVAAFIERFRMKVIIGMGSLGEATRRACRRHGCVYLQAVGGAGSMLTECIRGVSGVHFLREFGAAEAMWVLETENLEAVVAIDTHGRSLHRRVQAASHRAMLKLAAAQA